MLCHTEGPLGRDFDDKFVLLTEYATWRTQDKHSFAYLALIGPRGRRMGELLGIEPAKDDSCRNCHAVNFPKERQGGQFHIADGVSCSACHGPDSDWLGPHTERSWRLLPAKDKAQLGMRELRNSEVRSAVCVSCHIGSAGDGKVISHRMLAAGHPRLKAFDLASASERMPRHWRNTRDVPFLTDPPSEVAGRPIDRAALQESYHLEQANFEETRLTLIGAIATYRQALNLLARDAYSSSLNNTWPEFANFDCLGCHSGLQQRAYKSGGAVTPLLPAPVLWPEEQAKQIFLNDFVRDRYAGDRLFLKNLGTPRFPSPFGKPEMVAAAAINLTKEMEGLRSRLSEKKFTQQELRDTLMALCSLPAGPPRDFDSARQVVSALRTISTEWPRTNTDAQIRKMLDELAQEFNLHHTTGRTARLELMKRQYEQILEKKLLTDAAAIKGVESISDHGLAQTFSVKEPGKEKRAIGDQVRQFLSSIRTAGDDRLTDLMLKDPKSNAFLDALHEINEKELAEAMDKVPAYDPVVFRKRLEALRGLLPKE
jgi:hypothetical protein